jgi:hypothetical protein
MNPAKQLRQNISPTEESNPWLMVGGWGEKQ